LMDYIVTAIIQRVKAWRAYLGMDQPPYGFYFADDDIQYLSLRQYRELVLPYHKRLLAALNGDEPLGMHLCGNVQRHLPTIVKELNVRSFDLGFPIDFTSLRDEVGEAVEIQGGVPVGDLMQKSPHQVFARAESILKSGILSGGCFILKEANNLPPCTPLENIEAMYTAARTLGQYRWD
jgi:uroporphyrinogen-III decarboxylase